MCDALVVFFGLYLMQKEESLNYSTCTTDNNILALFHLYIVVCAVPTALSKYYIYFFLLA